MNKTLKPMRNISLLGAAVLLASACSNKAKEPEVVAAAPPPAPAAELSIPGTGIFPESLTTGSDGSIYIGSIGKGEVYRVAPGGSAAEPFIAAGTGGLRQVFGVLADAGTLWVCSNQMGGAPGAPPAAPGQLLSFNLATGEPGAQYTFPKDGMCNDIAVGPQGDVYATDTPGMQVMRLPKGGTALEVWAGKGAFGPPGGVLDGIAVVAGRVIVNTLITSKLFAVDVGADGKAGAVSELKLNAPIVRPDGMRAFGGDGLLTTDGTEGNGKVHLVRISGNDGEVTTLKEGLDGVVSVTTAGSMGYALEGQLGIIMAPPGGTPPAEKPFRAVGFPLP